MRILSGLLFLLASLLRRPLLAWVQTRVAPSGLPQELGLDPTRPVCYVLAARSITDQFVIEETCRQQGLPPPRGGYREMPKPGRAGLVALPRLEGQGMQRRYGNPAEIRRLVTQAIVDRDYDAQLVPVSVFWGRNPGQETSLLKIIFSDSLRAGPLRKLFIILFNGRNTFVSYGRPISFHDFMTRDPEPQAATRKLVRVLRVHFRRQRAATLGPNLINRAQVLTNVLALPRVREAIRLEAAAERISFEQAEERAWSYADEIAADYSNATLSFIVRVLTWLWNRIFDGIQVHHAERLREFAHHHGVVYLPAHRSHMDYLLVSYVLYQQGLVPPHVAAGINLNFWPVGGLIRRLGGFYLRRKFGGNKLYTAVFRAYLDWLMLRGYSMQFFPEGGRSRTGRLLTPKTGMLSMAVQSFLRNPDEPIVLVPIYTGYDKVMEVSGYFKELRGSQTKKNESVGDLISATRVVRMAFGKSYISFGEPLNLARFLDARQPDWRSDLASQPEGEWPDWFSEFITTLSIEVMTRINSAAALNPVGLVSTALLASPQKTLAEDELCEQIDSWMGLLRTHPYSEDVWVPDMSGSAILASAEKVARLTRIQHPWGDVIAAEGRTAILLTYYRNSVLHLLALPSLIASYFQQRETVDEATLIEGCCELYPVLRRELFLRWRDKETESAIRDMIDALVQRRLLSRDAGSGILHSPPVTSAEFGSLMGLANVMRETLERYCMTTVLLAENLSRGHIERSEFEQQCHLMAQRMAVLSGRNAPEFFDKALFSNYIDTMKRLNLLRPDVEFGDSRLRIDPQLQRMAEQSMRHLSGGTQQRIRRLLSGPRPVAQPQAALAGRGKS
ncbi:MAG: glycerol-3-phosphate 1-O-acyltransferase PlsB [Nevskiales bacterium]